MKNSSFLRAVAIALLLLNLYSCTTADTDNVPTTPSAVSRTIHLNTTQDQADLLLINYLVLKNNEYVLDISWEEAKKLGILIEQYEKTLSCIAETNKQIKDILKDTSIEFEWIDPQKILTSSRNNSTSALPNSIGARTPYNYEPFGTLRTDDNRKKESPFIFAPYETVGIKFVCISNAAPSPIFICGTYSSGQWKYKSSIGLKGQNIEIKVPLFVSNDYIRVSFLTSDSHGGQANYEGYQLASY